MKLRNKQTGEIMDDAEYRNYSVPGGFGFRMNGKEWEYHSLTELNEEWEDYDPAEPLIKDEKIRKAVRAWADALESEGNPVKCYGCGTWIGLRYERSSDTFTSKFEIDSPNSENDLELERFYTIAELCGEEEE